MTETTINGTRVIVISETDFDALRFDGRLKPERFYALPDGVAWSPDGLGFYFYATLSEAVAEHL